MRDSGSGIRGTRSPLHDESRIPHPASRRVSTMTCRAACESLNLILLHQASAQLQLIRGWLVVHPEHGFARPHVALGLPVAVEAPFHLQRFLAPHERHAIDLAVTGRAPDAFVHVNAVVEVHEVRQVVHARPLERRACTETVANGREVRAVGEDLRVAVHARPGWRNSGERAVFNGSVAVAAVDAVAGDVPLVAELDWLLSGDVD